MRNAQAHSTETETFEKRWRAYAAGAGAAAAGLLAFAPPAAGRIVVVPAHVSLGSTPFPIDIEGTTVFTFTRLLTHYACCTYGARLYVSAASGAGVVAHGRNQAAALKFGAAIRTADQFEGGRPALATFEAHDSRYYSYGPFANTTKRFLGLKFELHGQVYYGWAGFGTVHAQEPTVLTAYAYETEPNTPIYAGQSSDDDSVGEIPPQPATLGLLALGAPGLDIWRPRKRDLATE
jgi:hypothetical protein